MITDRISPSGRGIIRIQGVDPPCYFGIAHSLLFDHDFNLTNEFKVFPPADRKWTGVRPETGLPGSPYAIGYSLLSLPFLASGTVLDGVAGHPANGYGHYALLLYSFANVTFAVTGLFLLFGILLRMFGRFPMTSRWAIRYSVVAAFFGTSLLVYTFSPMAHAATFMCAAGMLLVWYQIRDSFSLTGWALFGLAAGFLSITRWQDMLFVLGPLLYDAFQWRLHVRFFPRWLASRALCMATFALCWIPQMMEWKAIYGRPLLVPQGDGFLQWPPSYFLHVLFSSSHGWFVWTPVVMIGTAGLMLGIAKYWTVFLPWFLVMLAEITVMGSMPTNWDGSDSFSIRSLTSCLPLIAIGLCGVLVWPAKTVRNVCTVLTGVFVLYSVVFAAQFRLDMIPRKGPLTASELLEDKLLFPRAYARREAHNRVIQLMDRGDFREAETVAENAIRQHGEDRSLLTDLENASLEVGDPPRAEEARAHLAQLIKSRLF